MNTLTRNSPDMSSFLWYTLAALAARFYDSAGGKAVGCRGEAVAADHEEWLKGELGGTGEDMRKECDSLRMLTAAMIGHYLHQQQGQGPVGNSSSRERGGTSSSSSSKDADGHGNGNVRRSPHSGSGSSSNGNGGNVCGHGWGGIGSSSSSNGRGHGGNASVSDWGERGSSSNTASVNGECRQGDAMPTAKDEGERPRGSGVLFLLHTLPAAAAANGSRAFGDAASSDRGGYVHGGLQECEVSLAQLKLLLEVLLLIWRYDPVESAEGKENSSSSSRGSGGATGHGKDSNSGSSSSSGKSSINKQSDSSSQDQAATTSSRSGGGTGHGKDSNSGSSSSSRGGKSSINKQSGSFLKDQAATTSSSSSRSSGGGTGHGKNPDSGSSSSSSSSSNSSDSCKQPAGDALPAHIQWNLLLLLLSVLL